MKELSFKEVINQIKEGEVWISEYNKIYFIDGRLTILDINNAIGTYFTFTEDDKFKLEIKKYSFEEALKFMREGKTVISLVDNTFYKIDGNSLSYKDSQDDWWFYISILGFDEILGEWTLAD